MTPRRPRVHNATRTARSAAVLALLCSLAPAAAAAETTACASAKGSDAKALFAEVSANGSMKQVFRDSTYIAFQDNATFAMWTFTVDGNPAHPSVVCRAPYQAGNEIRLDMVISCGGAADACQRMEQEFNALNAQMQAAMNQNQGPRQ